MEKEVLNGLSRENLLKIENHELKHKLKQQDIKMKIGQIQQQRLIE